MREERDEKAEVGTNLEPRILLEDTEKSYHAKARVGENDIFDNRLIFGDNLLALKALEAEFTGKVKCIYIDPPYNTGSAFAQYDDGVEHSLWLSLIRDRLVILRHLLSTDGSIWISIDDNECHFRDFRAPVSSTTDIRRFQEVLLPSNQIRFGFRTATSGTF